MQFRNKSDDARELTLDGVRLFTVEQGETIDVKPAQAAGLLLQCGPDGAWEPADDEAAAAVDAAAAPPDPEPEPEQTPEPSVAKTRTARPRTPKER